MSIRAFILFVALATVFLFAAWSREQGRVSANFPSAVEPLAQGERRPVVVELFTSEGCSSCPPADALLIRLQEEQPVDGAEVIALGFHVDYWDHLGWTDRFSSPEYSNRQRRYADAFNSNTVYTPQMIVDGHTEFNGGSERRATTAIRGATQAPKIPPAISGEPAGAGRIKLTFAVPAFYPMNTADTPELWFAVTEGKLSSEAGTGENEGRRLEHTAVVRYFRSLGAVKAGAEWSRSVEFAAPREWRAENCRVVAVLQERKSRLVLGATQAPLAGLER